MAERLEATIRGSVQGVGFRWFVVREAAALGLTGWTRNESDGSVMVVAEGEPPALDRLERHLAAGPPAADVRQLDARRLPATGEYANFTIAPRAHRGD